jgi:hypothetical protein
METKKCNKCQKEKSISEFYKKLDKNTPNCKECSKLVNKEYYNNNKEKLKESNRLYSTSHKDEISISKKSYYKQNKDEILSKRKVYRENNIDKFKEKDKKYQIKNREKINKYNSKYIKNKKESNSLFKLSTNIRNLLWVSIKKMGYTKEEETIKIIGCEFEEFKIYIESQFSNGMSWDNYGDWHLDHKIPISWAKNEEEVYEFNHYTNFQPMWASDNLSKGNRFSS